LTLLFLESFSRRVRASASWLPAAELVLCQPMVALCGVATAAAAAPNRHLSKRLRGLRIAPLCSLPYFTVYQIKQLS